jgi:hypothetical protein
VKNWDKKRCLVGQMKVIYIYGKEENNILGQV